MINLAIGTKQQNKKCYDYNQSLVSLATHSQSRLNSFQTVKALILHCFTCTSRLHLFSRLCPIFYWIVYLFVYLLLFTYYLLIFYYYLFIIYLFILFVIVNLLFTYFLLFFTGLAVRSKADETLVIVETLICPLQISQKMLYHAIYSK